MLPNFIWVARGNIDYDSEGQVPLGTPLRTMDADSECAMSILEGAPLHLIWSRWRFQLFSTASLFVSVLPLSPTVHLMHHLLNNNYSQLARPVKDLNTTTNVTIQIELHQIVELVSGHIIVRTLLPHTSKCCPVHITDCLLSLQNMKEQYVSNIAYFHFVSVPYFLHAFPEFICKSSCIFLPSVVLYTSWQQWEDEFLQWDPSVHSGVSKVHLKSSHIWTPDILPYNRYEVWLSLDCLRTMNFSFQCRQQSACQQTPGWHQRHHYFRWTCPLDVHGPPKDLL